MSLGNYSRIMVSVGASSSIFSSSWWLDATVGIGKWGVAEVKSDGRTIASMPWSLTNRFGLSVLSQPPLTPYLGPWIADPPPGTKYPKKLAREKDLMQGLIDQLPDYHVFRQCFAPEITNVLPFCWRGFQPTTLYTYRISGLSDLRTIWLGFQENIRGDIRKAENQHVVVEQSRDIEAFLDVNELTFRRQNLRLPYDRAYVRRIFKACEQNNATTIFLARGKDGRVHAGNLLVWNKCCAYYLMGGGDPELRNSGATSLAMWSAIQFASTVSQSFDFEGSMIEPIERFFRGFGAVQAPYFHMTHIRSKRAGIALGLRSALGALWL